MNPAILKELALAGLRTLFLIILLIFFMFPILWVLLTSLKTPVEQLSIPPIWIPESLNFSNYLDLFAHPDFFSSLMNSFVVSGLATVLTVVIGCFASYAIERFKVGGRFFFNVILVTRMIPPVVIIVPIFLIAFKAQLLDTHFLLIITYAALNIALVIWLLRDSFNKVPVEIEEAAMIDGCSRLQVLWKIVFPIIKPGVIATSLICFIFCWNEFIFALTLTGENVKTLPVLISSYVSQKGMDRGVMSAGGIIASIPIILITMFFQRYLIEGLTKGSGK